MWQIYTKIESVIKILKICPLKTTVKKASKQATARRFRETDSVQVFVSTIYKEYGIPWLLRWWSLPAERETWVRSLDREHPLERGMATHSSILAWRIPWMEEPGGLQSTRCKDMTEGTEDARPNIFVWLPRCMPTYLTFTSHLSS